MIIFRMTPTVLSIRVPSSDATKKHPNFYLTTLERCFLVTFEGKWIQWVNELRN